MRAQRGFTLIDGLISLAVLMLGVVGLLRLQGAVLQYNTQARYRVEASYIAEELIGLAQADVANVDCYVTNDGAAPDCGSTLAQNHVTDWLDRVARTLPGSDATPPSVDYSSATGDFTVTLNWQRPHEPSQHTFVARTNIYIEP